MGPDASALIPEMGEPPGLAGPFRNRTECLGATLVLVFSFWVFPVPVGF